MGGEEERGFVIRDRRSRGEGDQPSSEQTASTTPASSRAEAPSGGPTRTASAAGRGPTPAPDHDHDVTPPVSFSSFVFSLGTSALMLMGEQLSPEQDKLPVNLAQAKEIIDILSILESKTKGNLNSDEQSVLQDMLYALRMKYVDLASGNQATTSS
jgi:hypothetical protein